MPPPRNSDFGTAAKLTARILRGDLTVLRRHGIEVENIAELQELLRDRYEASLTPMQKVGKAWGDLKEQIGLTLMEAGDGPSVFDTVTAAIRATTAWVQRNTDGFRALFNMGVRPVIAGFGALYKAVVGVANVFTGVLFGVLGAGARGLALLADAAALAERAKARFLGLFSPEREAAALAQAAAIRENAKAIREWARAAEDVGRETILEGLFPKDRPPTDPKDRALPELPRLAALPGEDAEGRARAETIDKETAAAERLEEQREALIAQLVRDIEINGRRAEAYLEGEEAVEALNRELHIQDALLRAGVEQGDEHYETFLALAEGQYAAAEAAEVAAEQFRTSWTDAAEAAEVEIAGLTESLGGMFMAWATGGIKGLARFAKVKVLENVAWAVENLAKVLGGDLSKIPAVQKHGVAAAKWGVVAGAASVGAGGGVGGGAAGGTVPSLSGPNTGAAGRSEPLPPEININLYGDFDALNPRVQRTVYGAMQEAREVYGEGAKINVHRKP